MNLYNADGTQVELANEITITINAPKGTTVRPALTAEGQRLRDERKAAAERQRQEENERNERKAEEWKRIREEENKYRKQIAQLIDILNDTTKEQIASNSDSFIESLNTIVAEAWREFKPIEKSGKNKGEPKPLPEYGVENGNLMISYAGWKKPKILKNPTASLGYGKIETIWTHEAWMDVHKRIVGFIWGLKQQSQPENECEHNEAIAD